MEKYAAKKVENSESFHHITLQHTEKGPEILHLNLFSRMKLDCNVDIFHAY